MQGSSKLTLKVDTRNKLYQKITEKNYPKKLLRDILLEIQAKSNFNHDRGVSFDKMKMHTGNRHVNIYACIEPCSGASGCAISWLDLNTESSQAIR